MWVLAAALLFLQTPDFNAEGSKALDEGKYEAAAQAFQKAIDANPKDYYAHFSLGLADGFLHKDADGIAEYRKALELKPHLYEADLNAGILLMRQKNPGDALPLFADAAEQKPQEFQPRYFLAEAQLETGDAAGAAANFALAIQANAKSAGAEMGLAHALVRQGKLDEAAPHYRRAAQIDPAYRQSMLELADLYEKNRQGAEAAAIYREFPENAAAQERAGALMLDSKRYADAIPNLEAAYAKDASESNRIALAQAYLFAGQREKALPLLEKAAAAEPSNFDVRMAYARALRDGRQYAPAANQFAAAVQLKPADAAAWRDLGDMLYLAGDLPRALAAFEKSRQLGEDTPGNAFLRAIILDKLKQLKPALEAYRQFLSMSQGKNPDQEWQARQRAKLLEREVERR